MDQRTRTRRLLGALVAVLGLFALPQFAAAQADVLGMPVAAPVTPLDPEPQTWATYGQGLKGALG
jgi:hypothetical protein